MKRPPSTHRRVDRKRREERRTIKVFAEGAVTEYEYLRHCERRSSEATFHWGEYGMAPMTLVDRAREDVRRSRRSARRHGSPDFDEIWCVFDMDNHPDIPKALFEARQSNIHVALSNPCFELWLVLHCEDQNAFIERKTVQRRASDLGLIKGKRIPTEALELLEENYEEAKRRAKHLIALHEGNGTKPQSNPSTDIWRLVDRIRP
ncbi:MAG: RloB family protein [Acidimicrobiaceae bacterium]|nr:RloB family protein [Acidimicrobiaceae bacterium]